MPVYHRCPDCGDACACGFAPPLNACRHECADDGGGVPGDDDPDGCDDDGGDAAI